MCSRLGRGYFKNKYEKKNLQNLTPLLTVLNRHKFSRSVQRHRSHLYARSYKEQILICDGWIYSNVIPCSLIHEPGRVAQSVGHPTRKSGVLGSIPGLATYFRFSFRFFMKGSCQLLAKVCARSTGKPLRRSKPAQEKCG